MRSHASHQAFTLIELLVVISIISLLIAILLPALKSARSRAQQMQCATNVRSMNQAVFMYAADWKGWHPVEYGASADRPPGTVCSATSGRTCS